MRENGIASIEWTEPISNTLDNLIEEEVYNKYTLRIYKSHAIYSNLLLDSTENYISPITVAIL